MEQQSRRIYVYNADKQLIYVTGDYQYLRDAASAVSDWLMFNSGLEYGARRVQQALHNTEQLGGKYGFFVTDRHIYKSKIFYLTKHKGEMNDEILRDIGVKHG